MNEAVSFPQPDPGQRGPRQFGQLAQIFQDIVYLQLFSYPLQLFESFLRFIRLKCLVLCFNKLCQFV